MPKKSIFKKTMFKKTMLKTKAKQSMLNLSVIIACLSVPSSVLATSTNRLISLTVKIDNLHSDRGKIMAFLFQHAEGFPNDPINAHRQRIARIHERKAEIIIPNLKAGNYALALFHDENNDSKLNTTWFGKPKEGVGTSNNVVRRFSAPDFEDCQFTLTQSQTINIKVHYN